MRPCRRCRTRPPGPSTGHRATAYGPPTGDTPEEQEASSVRAKSFDSESITAIEEALRLDETFEEAWSTYLRIFEMRGELEVVLEYAERKREKAPESAVWTPRCAGVHYLIAHAVLLKRNSRAVELVRGRSACR